MTKTLAQTSVKTQASSDAVFGLWKDVDHWAEFDEGIEWAKLKDDFAVGRSYAIKPKGGFKVKATIMEVQPNQRFVDVSHLPGAKLMFTHTITEQEGSRLVSILMTISGPLGNLWSKILGKGQQADLEASTAKLVAKAERNG